MTVIIFWRHHFVNIHKQCCCYWTSLSAKMFLKTPKQTWILKTVAFNAKIFFKSGKTNKDKPNSQANKSLCLFKAHWLNANLRGKVVCEDILCPQVNCAKPFLSEGQCCPSCNTNNTVEMGESGCLLEGDKIFHPAGSRWHPYIPPFGFSRCATCTCQVSLKYFEFCRILA